MSRLLSAILSVICFALAALLLIGTGLPDRADYTGIILTPGTKPVAPEIGALAPPFKLPQLNGDQLQLADLRGNTVILNFWATWCTPCKVEMPELQRLYDERREQGLRIIGINIAEAPVAVKRWVNDFGLTFNIVLDREGVVMALYQVLGQPSTYVISPEGVITNIFYGPVDFATLQGAIDR